MMTPTARSRTFPRLTNFLNSFSINYLEHNNLLI
jgi:hypothetical protein